MEMQREPGPTSPRPALPGRAKTSQRLKYEAEIRVFTNRFGDLENVRRSLGYSRRRMCQLLLVDPSAWTRWHSPGGAPPPHIYRALEWFLILEGKSELHPRVADLYARGAQTTKAKPDPRLADEVAALRSQVARLKLYLWAGPAASAAAVGLLAWLLR